jgi:hypothetical protein
MLRLAILAAALSVMSYPVMAQVLFTDDFDAGPSSSWIVPAGGWSSFEGHYLNTATSGFANTSYPIFNGSAQLSNYVVEMEFSPTQASSNGSVLTTLVNLSAPAIPWPFAGTTGYSIGFGYNDCVEIQKFNGAGGGGEGLFLTFDARAHMDIGHTYVVSFAAQSGKLLFKVHEKGTADPGWIWSVNDATYASGYFGVFTWNTLGWVDNVVVTGNGAVATEQSSFGQVKNLYR